MSKIISDEEFFDWCGRHTIEGCGSTRMMEGCEREVAKCEDCRAKAQRDSSDKEWIGAGDELLAEMPLTNCPIPKDFFQALKQKVKENTNEQ